MAGALGDRDRQRLQALGVHLLPPYGALEALGQLLRRGAAGAVGVLDLDWPRLAAQASPRQVALLEPLVARANARAAAGYGFGSGSGGAAAGNGASGASGTAAEPPAYLKVLADTPPLERQAVLVGFVQQQLAKVMGLGDPQQIDPGEPLFNMGLDSLMALELTVLLEKNLGVRLTESLVFEHPTVDDLVRYFLRDVLFPETEPEAEPDPALNPDPTVQGHTTSGVSDAQKQPDFAMQPKSLPQDPLLDDPNLTPDTKSAPTADSWDQQVADVAAMDTADLLRQLRGE
jgi:acyl carrier protein